MTTSLNRLFDKVFKNKQGKKIVWQNPNFPLWGWILASVLGYVFKHGHVHNGFQYLGKAFLFTWAYLEIRSGESMFRRVLGIVIMASILFGFFRAW